jgi:hypothetical protein
LPLYKCLDSISEISSKEAERNSEKEGRRIIEICGETRINRIQERIGLSFLVF